MLTLFLKSQSKVRQHLAHHAGRVWSVVQHDRSNKRFKDDNSFVPVHADVFAALGVPIRQVTANYVRLAQKHPEAFDSPSAARVHVQYTMQHPDLAIPATKDGYTLVIRRGDTDRVVCVDLHERQGRYSVRSAYFMGKDQLEDKLKELARRQGGTPAVLALHGGLDPDPESVSRLLDESRDPLQPSLKKSLSDIGEIVDFAFSDETLAKSQMGLFEMPVFIAGSVKKDGTVTKPHIGIRRKRIDAPAPVQVDMFGHTEEEQAKKKRPPL